jgi:hypothetical protein
MPSMLSSPPPTVQRPVSCRGAHIRPLTRLSTLVRRSDEIAVGRPLAGYLDIEGRARELFALPGHAGSVLVLDRDAATLCDRRLVAHLAADEPNENAEIVCRHYLQDTNGRWCRRVRREDLEIAPFAERGPDTPEFDTSAVDTNASEAYVVDPEGNSYRLGVCTGKGSSVQLRWWRRPAGADDSEWKQVGLRDVVAALESYEPMRTLTERAIAAHSNHPGVLLTRLCSELERLCTSPIVLNRGLREAVLDTVEHRGMSMSEIALRCGIVKRDRRGKPSGETSWLARRVGIMPEGGEQQITPWVHSDVLAAIARKGLGISPREVELQ